MHASLSLLIAVDSKHPSILSTPIFITYVFTTHSNLTRSTVLSSHAPMAIVFQHSLLLILFFLPCTVCFRKIPALIVFGDSTVDAGNNNYIKTMGKANFPPYGQDFPGGVATGRFCNGRLSTDFISESLGLPPIVPAYLDPSYGIEDFAKGVCFASAGTGIDAATSELVSVIPLSQELEFFKEYQDRLKVYLGAKKAMHVINEAAYIISIGTNDFLENYFSMVSGRMKQFTVEEYEDFLIDLTAEFLTTIYWLGARKVSFTGLSPFGCVPVQRTMSFLLGGAGECIEEYNKVARDFNRKLQALIHKLCATLPGFKLRYSPIYELVLHVVQNPSSYGFKNAAQGCCGTGKLEMSYLCNEYNPYTCRDPEDYVFWDAIHPSEKLNRMLANHTLAVLKEFVN